MKQPIRMMNYIPDVSLKVCAKVHLMSNNEKTIINAGDGSKSVQFYSSLATATTDNELVSTTFKCLFICLFRNLLIWFFFFIFLKVRNHKMRSFIFHVGEKEFPARLNLRMKGGFFGKGWFIVFFLFCF